MFHNCWRHLRKRVPMPQCGRGRCHFPASFVSCPSQGNLCNLAGPGGAKPIDIGGLSNREAAASKWRKLFFKLPLNHKLLQYKKSVVVGLSIVLEFLILVSLELRAVETETAGFF